MTQAQDCAEIERTHALADGELSGAAADAARDHLATCEVCQAELADVLQIDAAAAAQRARRGRRSDRTGVVSLAWYRQRRIQVAAAAGAAAAAVVVYFALPHPRVPGDRADRNAPGTQVAIALAPHRMTEARLAWPGAAAYRAYDVPRAGDA